MNSTLWKIRCNLNPKTQAVNKAQRVQGRLQGGAVPPYSFKPPLEVRAVTLLKSETEE